MKVDSVAIILAKNNRILLNLRDDKPEIIFPNCWAFLGGGIEKEENEEQAIRREIHEEIGYRLGAIKKLENISPCNNRYSAIYLGKISLEAEELTLTEGRKIRFFKEAELKHLNMPSLLKELVKKYHREIFEII